MDWLLFLPELIVAGAALAVLVLDFMLPRETARQGLGWFSLAAVLAALVALLALVSNFGLRAQVFGGLLAMDTLAVFFQVILLLAAALVVLSSITYLEKLPGRGGEFYWLAMSALLGMMVTAAARELITIYIGIELLSLSFYALVGIRRSERGAVEAALKYFILGCFAIGCWLYGAALVYGLTGSTDLAGIAAAAGKAPVLPFYLGLGLLVVGFGFKMGLAPFQMWIPDTYQGAATPVTSFLAVGSKAAAFAVFLRVLSTVFAPLAAGWSSILGLLAILTMSWGNMAALRQTNIKRMLAYSGIAHAGYTLIGVVAFSSSGMQAVMLYLFGYLFANVGAFAVVIAFANRTGSDRIEDYAGLRWRNPYLALGLALCLLSLAGLPPLAGFFGKLFLFWGAVQQGGWLLWLVVIAALNSAISLYYYVNVIRTMYFLPPAEEGSLASPLSLNVGLFVALAGVLLAVFYFQPLLNTISGL